MITVNQTWDPRICILKLSDDSDDALRQKRRKKEEGTTLTAKRVMSKSN